jgi:urea transport system substrate-binding protein
MSGTMAISEVTVRDAIALAVEEINAAGGVLDKKIELIGEDGASEPTVFAEKAEKLIKNDCVAAVFGGWTSSSRKAMLPVFESNDALLYYPVQYEGLESSKKHFLHRSHHESTDRAGTELLTRPGVSGDSRSWEDLSYGTYQQVPR